MRRLAIPLLLVVVFALFGLGLGLDRLFEKYSLEPEDEYSQIQSFTESLALALNATNSPGTLLASWPESGTFTATLESKKDLPLPTALAADFEAGKSILLESENGVSIHHYLSNHNNVLSINTLLTTEKSNRGVALLFTALFYLGTLALVLVWLTPLLRRLKTLRTTARSFGAGKLDSRVSTSGFSYIRDIENDFNRMADKIQLLIDDNKLLTSAVSHDLRTPLARLRFGIDTLAETTDSKARGQYTQRISSDLNEMEKLVNSLLRYARLDNVLKGIEKQPLSLRQLISECVSQYHDEPVTIEIDDTQLDADQQLTMSGCIEHLAILINNLIQNAIVYAQAKLIIEMAATPTSIELGFCDDGPGIPEHLHEQVMKPFQRGTKQKNNGYGLGLAVVTRIASHHDATVELQRCARLGGARISVVFQRDEQTPLMKVHS